MRRKWRTSDGSAAATAERPPKKKAVVASEAAGAVEEELAWLVVVKSGGGRVGEQSSAVIRNDPACFGRHQERMLQQSIGHRAVVRSGVEAGMDEVP